MPFALPAAAAAIAAAAPAAVAKATLMTALKTVALDVLKNVAISAAMSLLQPQVGGGAGRTDEWQLSPDGPIPFAAGRIGVAGSVVYRKTYGPDLMYYGIPSVLSGAGPIDGFESFLADDEAVTFDGAGKAVSSQYANELWYLNRLGSQPDTALPSPTGLKNNVTIPGWSSSHKLSGKASYLIVMGENSKGTAYPTGEIKPLITVRGLKGWDPRLDSTYPGGSGPCRLNDPATWVYITNPIIWALKWTLGLWEDSTGKGAPQVGYQVGGIGAKLSGIDVPAFVSAANVADANGWTVAAYPNTDDDKSQVLDAFLQAGGAIYAQVAGKISCIQRAGPRASVVTISAADTAGPLEIDTAASRIDRINTLRPRFWSEPHRWQMTALTGEVTAATYRAEDGAIRTRGIDYPFVSNATQAGQLAALQIANTREGIAGVIPLKPYLQRIRPGDAFTITEPGFVLSGLKCLCLNTDYNPTTGVVNVTFVSETDGKYAFALGQSPTPPAPPVLTPVHFTVTAPAAGDWSIVPREATEDGIQLPIWDLVGSVTNDTATSIIVEWGSAPGTVAPGVPLADQIAWNEAYFGSPTATRIPIQGMQPGGTYYVAVRNVRGSNFSARTLYGPEDVAGKAPPAPAGLDAQAFLLAPDAVGVQQSIVRATWTAVSLTVAPDLAGYDTEYTEADQPAVTRQVVGTSDKWQQAVPGVNYTVRVRSRLKSGAVSVWTEPVQVAGAGDPDQPLPDVLRDLFEPLTEATALNTDQIAEEILRGSLYRAYTDGILYLNGVDVGTFVTNRIEEINDPEGSFVGNMSLLGSRNADGTGFILNADTVFISAEPGSPDTGVNSLRTLSLTTAANQQSITEFQTLADGFAESTTLLVVNGRVTGTRNTNDGSTGVLAFQADSVQFVDPDGTAGTEYRDGYWFVSDAATSTRTRYGATFGGTQKLVHWTGPSSVAEGAETKANAYVYISQNTVGGPRFGGSDVPAGTGSSGYAEAIVSPTTSFIDSSSGWSTVREFTVTGIPASPFVSASVRPNGGTGGTSSTVQFRLIETATGTVIGAPSENVVLPGIETPLDPVTFYALGSSAGSVSYSLQKRTISGGGTANVTIAADFAAFQAV